MLTCRVCLYFIFVLVRVIRLTRTITSTYYLVGYYATLPLYQSLPLPSLFQTKLGSADVPEYFTRTERLPSNDLSFLGCVTTVIGVRRECGDQLNQLLYLLSMHWPWLRHEMISMFASTVTYHCLTTLLISYLYYQCIFII